MNKQQNEMNQVELHGITTSREDDSFTNEHGEYEEGIFIQAVAEIWIPDTPIGKPTAYISQQIHSGGMLANCDEDEEYYKQIEQEEIEGVKYQLKMLGVRA